jgi:heme-degrading monooxygenase HmoA
VVAGFVGGVGLPAVPDDVEPGAGEDACGVGSDRVRDTGLADYRATPGNLGALIAVRDLDDDRAEVITLSRWSSMDAIRGFAGDDVERAAYYPQDDRYLLTKPEKVQHYQSHGAFDPPTHG